MNQDSSSELCAFSDNYDWLLKTQTPQVAEPQLYVADIWRIKCSLENLFVGRTFTRNDDGE